MKLFQFLLVLIVITSLFLEIQANSQNLIRNKKAKSSRKGKNIIDWLFGDWSEVNLEVSDSLRHSQSFRGKVRHVFFDQAFTIPFGVEFQGLQVTNNKQDTGFVQHVLTYEKLVNQGNTPKPVLDLRQIQNCAFTDNGKDWFGDWTIYFKVVPIESYKMNVLSQPYGSLWSVKLVMPAADKQKALSTKDKLYNACLQRSRQVNSLKANAINAGDSYYALLQSSQNRQQSLAVQVQQGQTQQNVLKQVQASSASKQAEIQSQINANQQALQNALKALQDTQAANEGAKQDIEKYSASLEAVKLQLSQIQQSQVQVRQSIVDTQAKLNEAINLQNSQKDQAAQLQAQQQNIVSSTDAEKAELARLVKEQADKMAKLQEEFNQRQAALAQQQQQIQDASAKKQADLAQQLNDNKDKSVQNSKALANTQASIEDLLKQINVQQVQSQNIDEQRKQTESSIAQIQVILDEKRDVAQQLTAKLQVQTNIQAQQDAALQQAKSAGQSVLAQLAAQEKAQLDRLDQSNKDVQAAQAAAKKSQDELNQAYLAFNDAINAINTNAKAAQPRTQSALEKSQTGQHKAQIDLINSNSVKSVRLAKQRLAKQQKNTQRLARIQKAQAKKVRLQRLKKQNKSNKKSKKSKKSKKQHKKQQE